MEIIVELSEYASCHVKTFIIDGKEADLDDFGESNAIGIGDYACGFMKFVGKAPATKVLDKYQITTDEYKEIIEYLNTALDYGVCNMCEQVYGVE